MQQRSILKSRLDLLKILPEKTIGVEIGVFKGDFSTQILETVYPELLILVDPWRGELHSGDENGENIVYIDGEECYGHVVQKFGENKEVKILRDKSTILEEYPDNFFDWGYIDGDHSFMGVTYDLKLLRKKVKSGGLIMGHDYCFERFGVVRAVNNFCQSFGLKIDYLTQSKIPSWGVRNIKT